MLLALVPLAVISIAIFPVILAKSLAFPLLEIAFVNIAGFEIVNAEAMVQVIVKFALIVAAIFLSFSAVPLHVVVDPVALIATPTVPQVLTVAFGRAKLKLALINVPIKVNDATHSMVFAIFPVAFVKFAIISDFYASAVRHVAGVTIGEALTDVDRTVGKGDGALQD